MLAGHGKDALKF